MTGDPRHTFLNDAVAQERAWFWLRSEGADPGYAVPRHGDPTGLADAFENAGGNYPDVLSIGYEFVSHQDGTRTPWPKRGGPYVESRDEHWNLVANNGRRRFIVGGPLDVYSNTGAP